MQPIQALNVESVQLISVVSPMVGLSCVKGGQNSSDEKIPLGFLAISKG